MQKHKQICVYICLYSQNCLYLHYQSKQIVYNGKDKNKTLKSKHHERVFERPDS